MACVSETGSGLLGAEPAAANRKGNRATVCTLRQEHPMTLILYGIPNCEQILPSVDGKRERLAKATDL